MKCSRTLSALVHLYSALVLNRINNAEHSLVFCTYTSARQEAGVNSLWIHLIENMNEDFITSIAAITLHFL